MMKLNKDIVFLALFSLLTILAWIIFDVYHTATTTTFSDEQLQLVTPLTPKLNVDYIQQKLQ